MPKKINPIETMSRENLLALIQYEWFAAIRTYLSTARKQGISMLRAAQLALLGTPFIPAIPK